MRFRLTVPDALVGTIALGALLGCAPPDRTILVLRADFDSAVALEPESNLCRVALALREAGLEFDSARQAGPDTIELQAPRTSAADLERSLADPGIGDRFIWWLSMVAK